MLTEKLKEHSLPLISVVIPLYNAEKTILRTVQSVLSQTFTDFELIIIDDGSTDSSSDIIAGIHDDRIILKSFGNKGTSASRNRGIKIASGNYISFIDADDLWTEDKLESQLKALRESPDAGLSYSWTAFIDESGKYLSAKFPARISGNVYTKLFLNNFIASGSNVLIKKACLEKIEWFNETLESGEDIEFLLRFAKKWPFALVPRYQILYRFHNSSVSSSVEKTRRHLISVIENAASEEPAFQGALLNRAKAAIYLHLCFLSAFRSGDSGHLAKSNQFIIKAIALEKKLLRKSKSLSIIITLIILKILPDSLRPRFAYGWIRLHGNLLKMLIPHLRTEVLNRTIIPENSKKKKIH